ncbi:Hsp70 family protein [Virgisporangium aurantiacum]|uniref:Hsp70 family protein n=1 Tax=Virgisporangium aurantiacum TaxID=175570 RepID=UPI00194DBC75|nr:Hsp70 family protein [Virgisporangium aurantiacum]
MAGGFRLGVDFGTTNTVAVLATPTGTMRQLLVDGAPVLPSAVCLTRDRRLLVGRDALHAARSAPEGFDPNPKRRIAARSVRLGGVDVAVVDMIAAVLGRVVGEARRVAGGAIEGATLTYPAGWDRNRCGVLQAAASRAGLPSVTLVPEPVAAGWSFLNTPDVSVPVGSSIVVYDFGAGTFDASVVRRSPTGFEVLASDGLADTGGINIDAAIVGYLGTVYGPQDAASWQRLVEPGTPADLRSSILLWDDVRAGKEMLSRQPATLVHVPLFETDAPLGREQFNELARPILVRTVEATRAVIAQARVAPDGIAGLFLVGGSSRIPLAATLLHQQLGIPPTVIESPELAVAEGALRSLGAVRAARPNERVDLMRGGVGGPYAAPSGFQSGPAPAYAGQTGAYPAGPAYATGSYPSGPYSPGPTSGSPAYAAGPTSGAPTSGGPAYSPGPTYSPGPGYQSGPQQPATPPTAPPHRPAQPPAGPQPIWAQTGTVQPAAPPAPPRNEPSRRSEPPRAEPPRSGPSGGGRHAAPEEDRTAPLWPSSGPPASPPPPAGPARPLPGDEPTGMWRVPAEEAGARPSGDEPIPDQVPFEPPPLPDASRPLAPVPASTDDEDGDFDFPDEEFPEAAAGVIWAGNVPTPPPQAAAPAPPRQPTQPSQPRRTEPTPPAAGRAAPGRAEPAAPGTGRAAPGAPAAGRSGPSAPTAGRSGPGAPTGGPTGRATPPTASRATPAMPPAAPPPPATPPRVQNPVSGSSSRPAADPAAEQEELRRALSSVRTRIDVVEHHITKLTEALSTMRRRFVHGTFRDIEPMEPRAKRQFRTAKEMFTIAERHAGNGNWSLVRTAIADTRQALEEATAAVAEVTGRLATLEKLAEDPKGPVERAQFVVRDAQRLFQMLSPAVPAEYGQRLDALASRAQTAARAASVPRPNYWDLHNEVTAIRDETQATIVAMRAARG